MALCCIGGVCVPYSAVVPLLVLGLQWLLGQLAAAGLLPPVVVHALRRFLPSTSTAPKNVSSCCDCSPQSQQQQQNLRNRRSKISKQASTATTASCCSDENDTTAERRMVFLESEEELTELLSASEPVIVVVKFTATWCKPCQAIQPLWEQLAQEYCDDATTTSTTTATTFAVADADELDEAAARYGVVALPTFVACRGGKVVEKYAGSNETKLREFCARVIRTAAGSN